MQMINWTVQASFEEMSEMEQRLESELRSPEEMQAEFDEQLRPSDSELLSTRFLMN